MSRSEAAPPQSLQRRLVKLALRVLVSAGVLTLLLVVLPWDQVRTAASRLTLTLYLTALAGFVAGHTLGAIKWRTLITASLGGGALGARATGACYGAGLFANLFLPTVVGGDVVRATLAARSLGRPEAVVLGSVADRLIDFASLGLLITAGAVVAGVELTGRALPVAGVLGFLVLAGATFTVPWVLRPLLAHLPGRVRRRARRMLVALRHISRRPAPALAAIALSLTMQALFIVISARLGSAVGAHAPLWAWFVAWPLAKVVAMLPVSLGGLGVRDAALAALLVPFGVPAAFGAVASLAWNAVVIGGALLGGLLGWVLRPDLGRAGSRPDGPGSDPVEVTIAN
ncbi:MAG TPA: lysylphosphatidylglycerol synthase transmembrane domain-containing protein [Longimicrobiales bacterium]|nr:lysylphosphatidylglycerol synthase transmembrane domain-containing protein [Longimicrobiales bacterium]